MFGGKNDSDFGTNEWGVVKLLDDDAVAVGDDDTLWILFILLPLFISSWWALFDVNNLLLWLKLLIKLLFWLLLMLFIILILFGEFGPELLHDEAFELDSQEKFTAI